MTDSTVVIVGAGPYGLSLAVHLEARKVRHRIFGRPMLFWSQIAKAGAERYLKSYCFGTNLATPTGDSSFTDYSEPRGLETFEPCSISHFAAYGEWFQQQNVPWVEPVDVTLVERHGDEFEVTLETGERLSASRVVIATGLAGFDHVPAVLGSLPPALAIHTSKVSSFAAFEGREVAVIGAGQSALEAAALLREAGARPSLLVRENTISWNRRVAKERSLWRRVRSPLSGLGSGPIGWTLEQFPGVAHRMPAAARTRFVRKYLPAEGAWWLRERVEGCMPIRLATTVVGAQQAGARVALQLRDAKDGSEQTLVVDHVIAGSGYVIDVGRLGFLHPELARAVQCHGRAPKLNASFEASVAGLHFVGPASAMSFGPLFRFVAGAEYTARTVTAHVASRSAT
jgi:cation diffusion facilitator CzcD-associated flavoprotein CzcO